MTNTAPAQPTVSLKRTSSETREVGRLGRRREVKLYHYDVIVAGVKLGTVHSYVYHVDLTPMARTRQDGAPRIGWLATSAVNASARSHKQIPSRQEAIECVLVDAGWTHSDALDAGRAARVQR